MGVKSLKIQEVVITRLQEVFGRSCSSVISKTAHFCMWVIIFVFPLISALQMSVQGFDKPENWFPPTLITYEFAIGEPQSVIPGDFNADGILDFVLLTAVGSPRALFDVPNFRINFYLPHTINFYLFHGKPEGWGEPLLIGALSMPERWLFSSVSIPGIDLDSDGNLDGVVILTFAPGSPLEFEFSDLENYLIILWGSRDTSGFTLDHMRLNVGLLPPQSLAAGDFNADGLVDLAFPDSQRLAIQVLYNRGKRLWSDPYLVSVAMPEDECVALPVGCVSGSFEENKKGDQLAVLSICIIGQNNFKQVLRFLLPQDEERWERSRLFPTGQQVWEKFEDAVGTLMLHDFDGDGCADLLLIEKMKDPCLLKDENFPEFMKIYLLSCPRSDRFENLKYIDAELFGPIVSAEYDPAFGWRIVTLPIDLTAINVLHLPKEGGWSRATALYVRGHIITAFLIHRGDKRELVVVSSLDLQSGVTLVNVITRRVQ